VNEINWREWGDEAFEEARTSGKPVLLSPTTASWRPTAPLQLPRFYWWSPPILSSVSRNPAHPE